MCSVVSEAHLVSPLPLLILCFAACLPCAQTVEASPRGPWNVITLRHLFMKVNDAYVRFVAQSLPPFATSINFSRKVIWLYARHEAVSRLQVFVS